MYHYTLSIPGYGNTTCKQCMITTINVMIQGHKDYMVLIEKAIEQSKNNMFNNTLDGVSAYVQQSVCNSPVPVRDQQETNAENCTQLPYHAHFNDILTEYPAWSTDANDREY